MKIQWLRSWNRWQFLITQLTLISVLFLYGLFPPQESLVLVLIIAGSLSGLFAQWIGDSLYPMIDQSRLHGDFRIIRSTMWVHSLLLLVGLAAFGGLLWVVLQVVDGSDNLPVSIAILGLVALDKVFSATLRAQASEVVLQAHALRRSVLLFGLILGLVLRTQPVVDIVLIATFIIAPLASSVRLMVGHVQFFKEFRYRRQFEDSGERRSLLSLFASLTTGYAKSFGHLVLPLGYLFGLLLIPQLLALPDDQRSGTTTLLLVLGALAFGRTMVATLLPQMTQWHQYVQANNHTVLREQLSRMSEQLLYRSLIAGLAWFGVGFILGPSVYGTLSQLLATTALLIGSSFFVFHQRVRRLLRLRDQWLIVAVALLIFLGNGTLLLIYYPDIAFLIGLVMSVVWIHSASLLVWTKSFALETRIHIQQSATMIGIGVAALIINGGIYWLLNQFPLGVEMFVEQLVFLGLFAIITSVVMYSFTYALGVHRSLKSRTEISLQLSTQFMEYEEEEAIW